MKSLLLALGLVVLATGCHSYTGYRVVAQQSETINGKLSGQWFTREVLGRVTVKNSGKERWVDGVVAIELVYCPAIVDQSPPPTCRTAVVYDVRSNAYLAPITTDASTSLQ